LHGRGQRTLVWRDGLALPGLPDGFSVGGGEARFNDRGEILFLGGTSGPLGQPGSGLWLGPPDALRLLRRTGQQADDCPAGVTYHHFEGATLNNKGQVAFMARLQGELVDVDNDTGIWFGDAHGLSLVAREGDPIPRALNGLTYGDLLYRDSDHDFPRIDDNGRVGFNGLLAGPGVTDTNAWAVFLRADGSTTMLARTGSHAADQAPQVGYELVFLEAVSSSGSISINAKLVGPGITDANNMALYLGDPGALHPVRQTGDPVAGLPGYVLYDGFYTSLNAAGNVLYQVDMVNWSDPFPMTAASLWSLDPAAEPPRDQLLVYQGQDDFEVRPGDLRTVGIFQHVFSEGADGRARGLGDHGEAAFWVVFEGNSTGVFATLPRVPIGPCLGP